MSENQTILPLEVIRIANEGYHCFVKTKLNDVTLRMVLDTGASRTILDIEAIRKLGLEDDMEIQEEKATSIGAENIDAHTIRLEEITIGEFKIFDYSVGIMDLRQVNQSYDMLQLPTVEGILGSDLLERFKATIDFGARRLVFKRQEEQQEEEV